MAATILVKSGLTQLLDFVRPQRKAMDELRAQWGKPGAKDGSRASEYFDLVRHADGCGCVDDKTFADLELAAIFSRLDTTVTPVGSQVLFRQLRKYATPDQLANRYPHYAELQSSVTLREALQRALLPLKDDADASIAEFIFGELPAALNHQGLMFLWSLLSVVVLSAVIAFSWSIWIWIAMVLVNVGVMYRDYYRTLRDGETLKGCLRLVKVADDLALGDKYGSPIPQLTRLADERRNRNKVVRTLRWRSILKIPFMEPVVALVNAAFLLEMLVHVRTMKQFSRVRHKLSASFELVGELDAAIAIASWLAYCPTHCRPALADRPVLEITDGRHPLLTDGVANSILLDRRSALITGSNMAGKTTFIKMIGVNALLAQTLGFCLAAKATIPRAGIMASIQARHSVRSGKSHYFSEVETIQSLLAQKEQGGCTIFVIDELFSGTNTRERLAIGRAVLESLSHFSLVLATTHDVELQSVLNDHYDLYHFQESPDVDGFFDYRLRLGPTTECNAIRLLKEVGFPGEIIANAMTYAKHES